MSSRSSIAKSFVTSLARNLSATQLKFDFSAILPNQSGSFRSKKARMSACADAHIFCGQASLLPLPLPQSIARQSLRSAVAFTCSQFSMFFVHLRTPRTQRAFGYVVGSRLHGVLNITKSKPQPWLRRSERNLKCSAVGVSRPLEV
jgi:hypothetical protein